MDGSASIPAAAAAASSGVGHKRAHEQACEAVDDQEAKQQQLQADGSDAEPPNKRARNQPQPQQEQEEGHKSVQPSAAVASSSLPSIACTATSSLASSGDASGNSAADVVASKPLALVEQQLHESYETSPAAAVAMAKELKATAIVEVRRAPSHTCELAFLRWIWP